MTWRALTSSSLTPVNLCTTCRSHSIYTPTYSSTCMPAPKHPSSCAAHCSSRQVVPIDLRVLSHSVLYHPVPTCCWSAYFQDLCVECSSVVAEVCMGPMEPTKLGRGGRFQRLRWLKLQRGVPTSLTFPATSLLGSLMIGGSWRTKLCGMWSGSMDECTSCREETTLKAITLAFQVLVYETSFTFGSTQGEMSNLRIWTMLSFSLVLKDLRSPAYFPQMARRARISSANSWRMRSTFSMGSCPSNCHFWSLWSRYEPLSYQALPFGILVWYRQNSLRSKCHSTEWTHSHVCSCGRLCIVYASICK